MAKEENKLQPGKLSLTKSKLALILAILAFSVYANTLRNDFALDDFLVISENHFVNKGISGIPDILTTSYHKGFNSASNDLYRPLSLVVFAVIHQISGETAFTYHLVNLLVFVCCVLILFSFLSRILGKDRTSAAFTGSLLFALHPIHTEVVANCKSLDELLCFAFAFLSLNHYLDYHSGKSYKHLIWGTIFLFISLMAKETTFTFLAVIPALFFMLYGDKKKNISISISTTVAVALTLLIRVMVLGYAGSGASSVSFTDNPLASADISYTTRVATAIFVLGRYLMLLIIPHPLLSDYTYNTIPFADFTNVITLLSIAAYSTLIFISLYRTIKYGRDRVSFFLLFFLLVISLFSNIPFLIGSNMAERFLFFPSVSFCVIPVLLLSNKQNLLKSKVVMVIVALISVVYFSLTVIRNADWANNSNLFRADIEKAPANSRLNFLLGNELTRAAFDTQIPVPEREQKLNEGVHYLKNAIEIYPEYRDAYVELGRAYYEAHIYDQAEQNARKALSLDPQNNDASNILGTVYMATTHYREAVDMFTSVLARSPQNSTAHFNLGACYANLKQYDKALGELRTAVQLSSAQERKRSLEYISRIYEIVGIPDSAQIFRSMSN